MGMGLEFDCFICFPTEESISSMSIADVAAQLHASYVDTLCYCLQHKFIARNGLLRLSHVTISTHKR